jgi:glutathione peroxidase
MSAAIYDIPLKTIDGAPAKLGDYAGKVMLVVNVASKCGLTPQYEGLEKLYTEKKDQGLVVLGFPSNDFRGQEPGAEAEIAEFCSTTYGVDFPMFQKMEIVGPNKHPLYKELTAARPDATGDGPHREKLKSFGIEPNPVGEVLWNFEKFLVGKDGKVVGRFAPNVAPDDPMVTQAIDEALKA